MELVRGTEAAALAAGRWMGRGDKNAADGAAVDAMRLVLNTVSMDGIVVIGEGEKDEAPMLFNGEEVGNGTAAAGRHRGRPARRHHAHLARPPQRDLGDRGRRARHDVRPRPVRLHGQDRGRARGRRRDRHQRAGQGQPRGGRQGARRRRRRHHRGDPRPRRATTTSSASAARPVPASASSRTATSPARSRRRGPQSEANILFGIGGTPEGVIAACALKAIGGAMQGRLWPRNDDERRAALDAGYDLDRVLDDRRPRVGRRRVLRRHRRHRRRAAHAACATGATARARSRS